MIFRFFPQSQHPSYNSPGRHLRWKLGWLRAQFLYRPVWSLKASLGLGPKVHWGKRICFFTPVRVAGSGNIFLGDDCLLDSRPDLYTHGKEARLSIGACSYINGTRFGCSLEITIGRRCILADARLMDTDFHSLHRERFSRSSPIGQAPILIADNVWLAAGSAVLKGVRIGPDAVIAFGSVVSKDLPGGHVYGGNPAKSLGELPY